MSGTYAFMLLLLLINIVTVIRSMTEMRKAVGGRSPSHTAIIMHAWTLEMREEAT